MRTSSPNAHRDHILVADDEPSIVGLLTSTLVAADYRVMAVRGLDPVFELLADPRRVFSAAVLDPGTRPLRDVLAAIRAARPTLPVLVIAASAAPHTPALIASHLPAVFLPKPFRAEELRLTVAELLHPAA